MENPLAGPSPANAIADRLLSYAVRVVKLSRAMPRDISARHIADQLLRSGTAPGALYEEARSAESRKDFVHKLTIALKELAESRFWLRLTVRAELLPPSRLTAIIQEADELCRILGKSRATARKATKMPNSDCK